MGFPVEGTTVTINDTASNRSCDFRINGPAGYCEIIVYEFLKSTVGVGQPRVVARIFLSKDDVDTVIAAIQTT